MTASSKRQARENQQQRRGHPRRPQRLIEDLPEREHGGQRHVRDRAAGFLRAAFRAPPPGSPAFTTSDTVRLIHLRRRLIDVRRRILADEVVLAVLRHADDLIEEVLSEELEPLADRVLIGPEALGHRLVDHDDGRRVRLVGFGQAAAAKQRDAQRVEQLRAADA